MTAAESGHDEVPPAHSFAFRPATYWPHVPTEETVLAQVKGTARRDVARALLEETDGTIPDGAVDFLLEPELHDEAKKRWGAIHPSHLGGEFLPDPRLGEVEIARVELASVTADVYQVLACPTSDGRIGYRVVDEYWDEGSRFDIEPDTSDQPLTLEALIELIDTASRADDAHQHPNENCNVGLFDMDRAFHIEECGANPAELVEFATASSLFYPTLQRYYAERAVESLREAEAALEGELGITELEERLAQLVDDGRWADSIDLPDDLYERAMALIAADMLDQAERVCSELGADAIDLRVMIAIRRGNKREAIRRARQMHSTGGV